jgi:molybdopterin converting factor small subunit
VQQQLKVKVKPYLYLQEVLGCKEIILEMSEQATVGGLFRMLRNTYGFPDRIITANINIVLFEGDEPKNLTVLVDGRHIKSLQGTATILSDGVTVALFLPSAGG